MNASTLPALSLLLCVASAAQAHPGHGDAGIGLGLLHLLASHGPPLALVGLLSVLVWLLVRDPRFVHRRARSAQRRDHSARR